MFAWLARVILRIIANLVGLQLAINYVAGASFSGGFGDLIRTTLILTALNLLLKPFLDLLLAPFVFFTLGLFGLLINAGMLWLATYWSPELVFASIGGLILTTLIITFINFLFDLSQKGKRNVV